jgi:hypothetical protein
MTHDAPPPLPDDPAVLQRMIRELLASLRQSRRDNEQLRQRLDQLLRRLYGPRAERFDPNQPWLFADGSATEATAPAAAPAPAPAPDKAASPTRGHGRQRLPGTLPRRRVVHDVAPAQRLCPVRS